MWHSVDFDFIHKLEGEQVTRAYVPDAFDSNSGVTIASGFDLGQRDRKDLKALGLSDRLCERCRPYLGLQQGAALAVLAARPLEITRSEAVEIDMAVQRQHLDQLATRFDAASTTPFAYLAPSRQTVIASVSFQYGTALDQRTPNFWRQITNGDWDAALANLRNFGDRYPTRRNREADLLISVIEPCPALKSRPGSSDPMP